MHKINPTKEGKAKHVIHAVMWLPVALVSIDGGMYGARYDDIHHKSTAHPAHSSTNKICFVFVFILIMFLIKFFFDSEFLLT